MGAASMTCVKIRILINESIVQRKDRTEEAMNVDGERYSLLRVGRMLSFSYMSLWRVGKCKTNFRVVAPQRTRTRYGDALMVHTDWPFIALSTHSQIFGRKQHTQHIDKLSGEVEIGAYKALFVKKQGAQEQAGRWSVGQQRKRRAEHSGSRAPYLSIMSGPE